MRRKLIIFLLIGIICVSYVLRLSSVFSLNSRIEEDKVLLDIVSGEVGAGNFSYWHLGENGPLVVELISLSGDADVYVSESQRFKPSYEVEMNNFSSATCGVDTVRIPADFPRPITVAVFGHWSHSISEYLIKVYHDKMAGLSLPQIQMILELQQEGQVMDGKNSEEKLPRPTENKKTGFLKLLNVLDMIFEMFVL